MNFQIPKIVHEEVDEHRGVFVIEPLDRGFGHTFGNSLRRVLLSSLEGAAVTSVKVEGTAHEFTTLPGVREDVTDIILNLKNLVARLHGESPEIEVHIAKKGPGSVTAADIEAPADLEILNPELEIANLYDKLTLDITTDGSVEPKDALAEAAEILIRQLAIFTDLDRIEGFGEAAPVDGGGVSPEAALAHGMENFPIEELELGVRSSSSIGKFSIPCASAASGETPPPSTGAASPKPSIRSRSVKIASCRIRISAASASASLGSTEPSVVMSIVSLS